MVIDILTEHNILVILLRHFPQGKSVLVLIVILVESMQMTYYIYISITTSKIIENMKFVF